MYSRVQMRLLFATGTPKTFDAEGFKNKLSSLAIIAGGAGTIILYCKAIKEIEKECSK